MNFIKYLKQPFPLSDSKWSFIIPISLFILLFLNIFQPFGLSYIEKNKILILSGYSLITFLTLIFDLIILEKLFPSIFKESKWTVGKEFIWLLWIIFSIGLGNALYTFYVFNFFEFSFHFFIRFEFFTLSIGIIPVTVVIISIQNNLLNKHIKSANDFNKIIGQKPNRVKEENSITFYGDNKNESVQFDINEFLFIESTGNYINLHLLKNNELKKLTYRCTIKRAIESFKNSTEILQCHRAFIVNTNQIINVKGNSQGLRLNLENCETEVPVSRGYVNTIREKIN